MWLPLGRLLYTTQAGKDVHEQEVEMTQHADGAKDGRRAIRAVCHAMACGVVLSVCVLMIVAYTMKRLRVPKVTPVKPWSLLGAVGVADKRRHCSPGARFPGMVPGLEPSGSKTVHWSKATVTVSSFPAVDDGMPDAVFIQTDGQLTYANPVACALWAHQRPMDWAHRWVLQKTKHAYITERIAQLDAGSSYT